MQYTALPTWSLAVAVEASADLLLPRWQLTSVRRVHSGGWHEILSNSCKLTQIQPSDKSLENFQSKYFFCSISCLWWWPVSWGKAAEKGKYVVLLLGIHPSLAQNVEVRKWSWCILDFWKATVCALWAHLSPHKDHLNEKFEERNTFSFFTKLEGLKGAQVQS